MSQAQCRLSFLLRSLAQVLYTALRATLTNRALHSTDSFKMSCASIDPRCSLAANDVPDWSWRKQSKSYHHLQCCIESCLRSLVRFAQLFGAVLETKVPGRRKPHQAALRQPAMRCPPRRRAAAWYMRRHTSLACPLAHRKRIDCPQRRPRSVTTERRAYGASFCLELGTRLLARSVVPQDATTRCLAVHSCLP